MAYNDSVIDPATGAPTRVNRFTDGTMKDDAGNIRNPDGSLNSTAEVQADGSVLQKSTNPTANTSGYIPGATGVPGTGTVSGIPGAGSSAPIQDSGIPGVPGAGSKLPGADDPAMQSLYKANAEAGQNLNSIQSGMHASMGNMGSVYAPLQGMFDTVLKLAGGVGQKKMAMSELQNAQKQWQEREQHQTMAAYYGGRVGAMNDRNVIGQQNADSRQQDSDTKVAAENRRAAHQAVMDDLDAQLKAGRINGQQYLDAKYQAEANLRTAQTGQITAFTPKATAPAVPAAPPSTGAPQTGINPNIAKYGAVTGVKTAMNGQKIYQHADNNWYDWNGNKVGGI
ncbi:MAG: hypothetical protein HQK98_06550 [Nitrospirae bacterium]|nr:hypothetical protein [Nitrospirota bacterium]